MIQYENQCVDCGLPCLAHACANASVPIYYCDNCGDEIDDDVYEADGDHLCESCLKTKFKLEV